MITIYLFVYLFVYHYVCLILLSLGQVTNLWGDGDIPVKDLILKAPRMGLEGDVVSTRGNRSRHRRVRKRQKRNEFVRAYGEIFRPLKHY